jgi:hypothetical protein
MFNLRHHWIYFYVSSSRNWPVYAGIAHQFPVVPECHTGTSFLYKYIRVRYFLNNDRAKWGTGKIESFTVPIKVHRCCNIQDYITLYYTIIYYTILYYTILYYTILYYTILYYTILYYTILYYTILYYIIIRTYGAWKSRFRKDGAMLMLPQERLTEKGRIERTPKVESVWKCCV